MESRIVIGVSGRTYAVDAPALPRDCGVTAFGERRQPFPENYYQVRYPRHSVGGVSFERSGAGTGAV